MSNTRFQKSALAAAVLSLGFSMGALAQGSAGSSASGTTSSGTGASAAQGQTGAGAADRSGSSGSAMSDRSGNRAANPGGTMSRDSASPRSDSSASAGSTAKGPDKMARGDHKFLEEAYMGSMAEVRLGKLAQQKAASNEVKEFGQRMVDDHTKAIEQLSKIAKDDDAQLPSQLDRKHQRTYDRLSKLSGAEFDRAYMKEMASDHKKDVSEYEKAAKSSKDDQLQQHAQQTLRTLREHRKMAESTRDALQKSATVSMRTDNTRSSPSQSPSQNR